MVNTDKKVVQKPLLEIPNDFIEKLVALISDPTEEGGKKIVSIAEQAKINYKYWLYYFTRTRDIDSFIDGLNDAKDPYYRWEVVKKHLSEGEWNDGSYNFYFLLELVNAIPGYETLDRHEQHSFVLKLKDPIMNRLIYLISDYKKNQEEIKRRNTEKHEAGLSKQRQSDVSVIEKDLDVAITKAKVELDKTVFCLVNDKKWALSLIDVAGKVHSLDVTLELKLFLSSRKVDDVTTLNPEQLGHVKTECLKAKARLLQSMQLLINPEQSNMELVNKGKYSTFILRRDVPKNSLWWINSLGAVNYIDLKDYPLLEEWVNKNTGEWHNEDINSIKLHLLGVKTAKSLTTERVSLLDNKLNSILKRRVTQNSIEEVKQDAHERALNLLQYIINPEQRNKELMSMNITSTFILRHTAKEHSLWWANSVGVINQVKLKEYPELLDWLKEHPAPFSANDELALKEHLLAINPARALSKTRVQELENLLGSRFREHAEGQLALTSEAASSGGAVVPKSDASYNEGHAQKVIPKPLSANRYQAIYELPTFWKKERQILSTIENAEQLSNSLGTL